MAEAKKDVDKIDETKDPELDELLDSALEDLINKPAANTNEQPKEKEEKKTDLEIDNTKAEGNDNVEWSDEFIRQAASQFETNMASLLENIGTDVSSNQLQQNFQRMAEAAAQVISNPQTMQPTPESDNFAATITQTLQNLSMGSENLQSPLNNENLMNMFTSNVNPDDSNAFIPFMQGMMQSLLSKEVLYPSLKDILDRYPSWLDDHRSTLSASEIERYENQITLMTEICTELEAETEGETETVKRSRFEKVLGLMQRMQDLGQPPTELVGDPVIGGIHFDPQGNPILPTDFDPNQCVLM